jgi:predicted nucleotide-binding protein (sugar kinase/HSP70/actin superfamily)
MKIGIPKAFFYFRYGAMWESFFDALGIETIVSPDTNKDIVERGSSFAVDESCLSNKIYLGHVAWLMDKCDYVLVPRIGSQGRAGTVCTRFFAVYDMIKNTFRDTHLKLLNYNIDLKNKELEPLAFVKLGRALGKTRAQSMFAYWTAKQSERAEQMIAAREQERLLATEGVKVLVIAHPYNIYDQFIGAPVLSALKAMDAVPVLGCAADPKKAAAASYGMSDTLPWVTSRELIGAIAMWREQVDGIIILSTFPCGPDSMVNEIVIRRVKDKPILNLILDGQEGTAGLETRLESFIDIIRFKRDESVG